MPTSSIRESTFLKFSTTVASLLLSGCGPSSTETENLGVYRNPPHLGGSSGDGDSLPSNTGGSTEPPSKSPPELPDYVPLFDTTTDLDPKIHFDRGDAVVTRFADRARDRHAREDQFQSYDHYLSHYWLHRTARFIFEDYVSHGGTTIDISFVTEWELDVLPEFRAWYYGMGTVAHYHGNYAPRLTKQGPGLYDNDLERVGDGVQYKYTYTIDSAITLEGEFVPLKEGQFMEIEVSQFLSAPPVGRDNYYGTTFLYEVGPGGLVPWFTVGNFDDKESEREDARKLPERGWLGGRTTLPYQYSDEPDNHFMQMATNLSSVNGQPFVRGRRVHHTNMVDGSHDESDDNPSFEALAGLAGSAYINTSCDSCHKRNGRAPVADLGEALDRWVFKIGAEDEEPDPMFGRVLQPAGLGAEPNVSIAEWIEKGPLRRPRYEFEGASPDRFSARLAPQLVGLGLLEAVPEEAILERVDPEDSDGNGISGRVHLVTDPETGEPRIGRFGYKATSARLRHQVAAALNTDMGVMTSVFPEPDCGAQQICDTTGDALSAEHLDDLVRYVALLGVRARRDLNDPQALEGEIHFKDIGCADCHTTELKTSSRHPFAELREQVIHPYTDLLVHDMGDGLADNLSDGQATGAEWRTAPLWGIGLSPCVTGGVEGPFQDESCTPDESYLHDGRARSLEEAILWHGGEGAASRASFETLSEEQRRALFSFLRSL